MSQSRWENLAERRRIYADWPKITFPLNRIFRLLGRNPTIHVRGGPSLEVRLVSDDLSMVSEVLGRDSYGLRALALGKDPIVVDIGGNIGAFCAAVRRNFPGAQVTAYEPHPANFALLQANCPWAQLEQKAVAGAAGQVHIEDSRNTSALRLAPDGIAVPAVTLEQALAPFSSIDLLKVDIEGSEYEVFSRADPSVMEKVRRVTVEVHKNEEREWFERFFCRYGFSCRWDKDLLMAER